MVPEQLISRWEIAYRTYGQAATTAAQSAAGDRQAARALAAASSEVAAIWRAMASAPDLPWWVLAATGAAAQAFEQQARDWQARAKHDGMTTGAPMKQRRRPVPIGIEPAGADARPQGGV